MNVLGTLTIDINGFGLCGHCLQWTKNDSFKEEEKYSGLGPSVKFVPSISGLNSEEEKNTGKDIPAKKTKLGGRGKILLWHSFSAPFPIKVSL